MNQINPLHIGALLVTLIAYLFFTLNGAKEELQEATSAFEASEKVAIELRSLKDVYADKKRTKRALERIFAQSSLRSAALVLKRDKESLKVSSKSMDATALNSLMGKILNGSYKIERLKIKRISNTKASLEMEIKW